MTYKDLSIIDYAEAWQIQEKLFNQNLHAKQYDLPTKNYLLVCEHQHVITIGKSGKTENLLFTKDYLADKNITVFAIDRGGDVTYHGPGQLVVYPIFDLETYNIGLRKFIFNLEEVMIRLLALYNIRGERNDKATGVWIDCDQPDKTRKIGAIGVRCSRFITMHGLALNINTDLSYFSYINPCGFRDKGVTSLAQELGHNLDFETIKEQTRVIFEEIFKN